MTPEKKRMAMSGRGNFRIASQGNTKLRIRSIKTRVTVGPPNCPGPLPGTAGVSPANARESGVFAALQARRLRSRVRIYERMRPLSSPGRVRVIDSHTAGEPTRVVISGGPELGYDSLAERLVRFRNEHDDFRSAVINEPRGSDALVGALLCAPLDDTCVTGVLFFNHVAYLGMCGHGTIGVIATLAHLGRIEPGTHRIETPVGVVVAHLYENGEVEIANVPSYRYRADVTVLVPGIGPVTGDIAWGGNWFFLVNDHGQELTLDNLER